MDLQNKTQSNNLNFAQKGCNKSGIDLDSFHLKFDSVFDDPWYKQVKDELRVVGQEIESIQLSTV